MAGQKDGLVEARGSMPPDKLDAWAGFLQGYASQFADLIPLRSWVGPQGPQGSARPSAQRALYLGAGHAAGNKPEIDISRLKNGTYSAADLLVGDPPGSPLPSPETISDTAASSRTTVKIASLLSPTGKLVPESDLNLLAGRAIELWADQKLDAAGGTLLQEALERLFGRSRQPPDDLAEYKRLLARSSPVAKRSCWSGSQVSVQNVAGVVFWLDVLFRNRDLTTMSFDEDAVRLLAEAALNPMATAACMDLASDGRLKSLYLEEASRAPGAAKTLLRDVPEGQVDISGLSLSGPRYFQSTEGRLFREGEMATPDSSVISIGELGVLFATNTGIAATIFTGNLTWRTN